MSNRIPKYRKQKLPNGYLAFVELNGQRFYLGKYNSRASRQKYHQLLAEWDSNGQQLPVSPEQITIVELVARYWKYAQGYYVKPDGTPTILHRVKRAIKPVKDLYGTSKVANFGPNSLRAVRQTWILAGLARKTVNDYTRP